MSSPNLYDDAFEKSKIPSAFVRIKRSNSWYMERKGRSEFNLRFASLYNALSLSDFPSPSSLTPTDAVERIDLNCALLLVRLFIASTANCLLKFWRCLKATWLLWNLSLIFSWIRFSVVFWRIKRILNMDRQTIPPRTKNILVWKRNGSLNDRALIGIFYNVKWDFSFFRHILYQQTHQGISNHPFVGAGLFFQPLLIPCAP